MQLAGGSLQLGRVFGVAVSVHWSWALVAVFEVQTRKNEYTTQAWNVAEYLTLFAIVLAHELGHALACRSVGGRADRIVLWPLGGIAFVQPPARPGALLWSIAAGPLVNLAFLALTTVPVVFVSALNLTHDLTHYAQAVWTINLVMLVFNLLPVYPLDGGQIVQALLWFLVGRARSLAFVSVIGIIGAGSLIPVAFMRGSVWLGAIALYAGLRATSGLAYARAFARMASAPRREGFACPRCRAAPPVGTYWRCACGQLFDTFATRAKCPACQRVYADTACLDCNQMSPHAAFYPAA
jgi:Zn-dependent protease